MQYRPREIKKREPLNMGQSISLVFIVTIAVGSLLLLLPFSSRDGRSCGLITALFTATSATCVTGLSLADTWTQWSGVGQVVIFCLIEVGGLGFMAFAASAIFLFRRKVRMNECYAIAYTVGSDDMSEAVRVQKKMLSFSIGAEILGAAVLTLRFMKDYDISKAVRLGVFHSVSAFCNAGFDIFGFEAPGGSISLYGTDGTVVFMLSSLIVFGGLGFIVWSDVFRRRSLKKWSVYTRLVLIATAVLLILGMILICVSEWNNPQTLGTMNISEKLKAGFFQSVTSRTAGFAGMDQGAMTDAGKAVTMFLMLIGGSSASTAGGLKTVTFVVLVLFLRSMLRGKENVSVFHRSIPKKQVLNALTVFGIMVSLAFFGATVICVSSPVGFTDGLFESISALATVGLSTGITPSLSLSSKLLLIVYMYFGRVGILTLSLGFMHNKELTVEYKYADTNLLIG